MDQAELDRIREELFKSMDDQLATNKAALETSQRLGQQKLMYSNDARGTLYSGQPTWERAQLAAQGISDLANLNQDYMKSKLSAWNNITNIMDQINSYNKAASALAQATQNATSTSAAQQYLDLYNQLNGGS